MSVRVSTRGLGRRSVQPAEVARRAERMLLALGLRDVELSVMLCGDPTIRALNRRYRGIDRPTDVLAFAMREGEGGDRAGGLLGDVVVSLDTARREARRKGHAIVLEVTILLAHGLLHLLGYDHQTRAEERRMGALTDVLQASATPRKPG